MEKKQGNSSNLFVYDKHLNSKELYIIQNIHSRKLFHSYITNQFLNKVRLEKYMYNAKFVAIDTATRMFQDKILNCELIKNLREKQFNTFSTNVLT